MTEVTAWAPLKVRPSSLHTTPLQPTLSPHHGSHRSAPILPLVLGPGTQPCDSISSGNLVRRGAPPWGSRAADLSLHVAVPAPPLLQSL